jgi:NADH dehydrogenase
MAHVYVIGDTAMLDGEDGKPLPALAQVAAQQGTYLGKMLARGPGAAPPQPFRFRNRGNTAIIGRNAAIFDFGWMRLKGRLAWMLWAIVHVYLLVGFENRLRVSLQWFWRYLTYEQGARLILATAEKPAKAVTPDRSAPRD